MLNNKYDDAFNLCEIWKIRFDFEGGNGCINIRSNHKIYISTFVVYETETFNCVVKSTIYGSLYFFDKVNRNFIVIKLNVTERVGDWKKTLLSEAVSFSLTKWRMTNSIYH